MARANGFIGGSYTAQNPLAVCDRTVNWYPEVVEARDGKSRQVLLPTPGFSSFATSTDVGVRALWAEAGRCFACIGGGLWEVFASQTMTWRGALAQDNNPATMSYNGLTGGQLFITSGGNGYCYTLATNTLTQVLTNEATQGAHLDGYFLAFNVTNGKVRISALNDGTTWPALTYFQRSIAPDPWQAMVVSASSRQIWLIGTKTGEVWYDAGTYPVPFAPVQGATFGYGTVAPFSVGVGGDAVRWLSQNEQGAGIVVRARGYAPERMSNYAVETAVSAYQRNASITDAELLIYQQEGHVFSNFRFPSVGLTWTVDDATNDWHERGVWQPANNRYDVWFPRAHAVAFGRHLVGGAGTGTVYSMDVSTATDFDGSMIRRLRRWAGPFDQHRQINVRRFELYLETGLGLQSGQGRDPQVMLRLSDDGGQTWGNERTASAGAVGAYRTRVVFTRWGVSRDRVCEFSVSDPVPWRLVDGFINPDVLEGQAA